MKKKNKKEEQCLHNNSKTAPSVDKHQSTYNPTGRPLKNQFGSVCYTQNQE